MAHIPKRLRRHRPSRRLLNIQGAESRIFIRISSLMSACARCGQVVATGKNDSGLSQHRAWHLALDEVAGRVGVELIWKTKHSERQKG